jgi:hypothetical protein
MEQEPPGFWCGNESGGESVGKIALQFADALCEIVAQAPIPMAGAISKIGKLLAQLGEGKMAIEPRPVSDQIRLTMEFLIQRLVKKGRHLYVLVDDLDRCSPRNVVRLFEWFKNHLDVARCTYIIGLDHRMAARAIAGEYSRYTAAGGKHNLDYGYRYLDKLFELDFEILPTPEAQSMALRKHGLTGDVAQWTHKRLGKDFSDEAEMKALLGLPALWIPRVMIRTFGTYKMALDALLQADHDERIRLRNDLPSSYPFWLFLLCALHHLFSPDKAESFSRQDLRNAEKGAIGHVLNPEGDLEPIDPRVDLVEQLDDLPKRLDPLPRNQLRYLYGIVRDKTPGALSVA